MDSLESQTLKIGGYRAIPMPMAIAWLERYTDGAANRSSAKPFAFPAYDRFRADDNQPHVLDDADLLAPILLNVGISLRSYYALQRHRSRLEAGLAAEVLARPLVELTEDEIHEHIGGLFSILDDVGSGAGGPGSNSLPGIGGTKLSKVLHRKRPASIPLHDKWVRSCYVGAEGYPIPLAASRTWRDYMTLIAREMAADIRCQAGEFAQLREASKASPDLTDLRLLDIVAWNVGRAARSESATWLLG